MKIIIADNILQSQSQTQATLIDFCIQLCPKSCVVTPVGLPRRGLYCGTLLSQFYITKRRQITLIIIKTVCIEVILKHTVVYLQISALLCYVDTIVGDSSLLKKSPGTKLAAHWKNGKRSSVIRLLLFTRMQWLLEEDSRIERGNLTSIILFSIHISLYQLKICQIHNVFQKNNVNEQYLYIKK